MQLLLAKLLMTRGGLSVGKTTTRLAMMKLLR